MLLCRASPPRGMLAAMEKPQKFRVQVLKPAGGAHLDLVVTALALLGTVALILLAPFG